MSNWLTSYEAADMIGKCRTTIEVWGRNGRVRRKVGVSPERHSRPMWLYHVDDVLQPKPLRTYSVQSIDSPTDISWQVTHKPWTREALTL